MKSIRFLMLTTICVCLMFTACSTTQQIPEKMPDVFAIYYSNWFASSRKNIFDTYEGYIQKDLVMDGIATTEYNASDDVLLSIYKKIKELDLCSIDQEMTSSVLPRPCSYYEIKFTIDGVDYKITGDDSSHYDDKIPKAKNFWGFIRFIRNIMTSTEEYKSLPDAEGGYE